MFLSKKKQPREPAGSSIGGRFSGGESVGGAFTDAETAAVTAYSDESYHAVNGLLRNPDADMAVMSGDKFPGLSGKGMRGQERRKEFTEDLVSEMDSAMAKSSLGEDTTLYRGVTSTKSVFGVDNMEQVAIGTVFEDKAFVSTTKDFDRMKKFGTDGKRFGEEPAYFRVKAKKGQSSIDISAKNSSSAYAKEQEVLLPRGTRFKVTSYTPGISAFAEGAPVGGVPAILDVEIL